MARVDFGKKAWLYPEPVLIIGTYDEKGVPNAMNAAWGAMYDFTEVVISLSEHKTTENLLKKGAFSLSFATKKTMEAADYVGIVSGKKVPNKIEKVGWHALPSKFVDAPLFEELPLAMECKVKSFEGGILVGEIVNVSADESILTDGKPDVRKLEAICFDPLGNHYVLANEVVGDAFQSKAKFQ
ncbi:MAG: flavin reductase family protein [Bacilli bacterium]|nr:flavin reductase family protein [Bacilli bacterium]